MKIEQEQELKPVITSRFVMQGSPILYVMYDEDGDWQLFGAEEFSESDAMVVSIKQALECDASLRSLPDMEKGQSVFRADEKSPWQIE